MRSLGLPPVVDRAITPEIVGTDAYSNPEYLEALETIIGSRIHQGQVPFAAEASRRVTATFAAPADASEQTHIERASLALHAAWVARGEESWDEAEARSREAAVRARSAEAPWWVARAIRALPAGMATDEELAEAEDIERRLRVAPGATAPPV
jgi:hypothetical protein